MQHMECFMYLSTRYRKATSQFKSYAK